MTESPTPVSGDAMELVERLELPDDVRVPLHSLQADVGYLIGRVQADGSCGSEIAASIISRLTAIEMAVLRLRSQGAPDVRGRPSPLSPYHEQDDDSIAALASARKGAASDKDAAAIAWAEDEIAALRQAEQAAVRLANELAGKLAKLRSQGGAPEGWKIVPVEPTGEMIRVGRSNAVPSTQAIKPVYRAMLSAAPQPPVSQSVQPPEGGTGWRDISTLPPPGERPGTVWVLVEGSQFHSGAKWFRRKAGLARTHNEGFEDEDIRLIEKLDLMDPFTGRVTHWLPINLPPPPGDRTSAPTAANVSLNQD